MLLALAAGAVAFGLGSQANTVDVYLSPGLWLAGVLAPVIPTRLSYAIDSEGGPAAFVLLTFVCSVLSWTMLFAGLHYAYARGRRRALRQRT